MRRIYDTDFIPEDKLIKGPVFFQMNSGDSASRLDTICQQWVDFYKQQEFIFERICEEHPVESNRVLDAVRAEFGIADITPPEYKGPGQHTAEALEQIIFKFQRICNWKWAVRMKIEKELQ